MTDNPLNKRNYAEINAALYKANQVRELVEKAKEAGLPVEDYEKICDHYDTHLAQLKKVFFPGKP